jgi:hypothetical protein
MSRQRPSARPRRRRGLRASWRAAAVSSGVPVAGNASTGPPMPSHSSSGGQSAGRFFTTLTIGGLTGLLAALAVVVLPVGG